MWNETYKRLPARLRELTEIFFKYLYGKVIASEKGVIPFHRLGENVNGRGWRGTAIKPIKL